MTRRLNRILLPSIYYGVPSVNCLSDMSISIQVASEFFCMPKSIYNMLNFTCHMLHFINGMHNLMCDMRYLINVPCSVFYAMHPDPPMIHVYPFRYVACLNPCMMCLKDSIYYMFSILRIDKSLSSE